MQCDTIPAPRGYHLNHDGSRPVLCAFSRRRVDPDTGVCGYHSAHMTWLEQTSAVRFSQEDEEAMRGAMVELIDAWRRQMVHWPPAEADTYPVLVSDLARAGGHAIGCTAASLRPREIEWTVGQAAVLLGQAGVHAQEVTS